MGSSLDSEVKQNTGRSKVGLLHYFGDLFYFVQVFEYSIWRLLLLLLIQYMGLLFCCFGFRLCVDKTLCSKVYSA